MGQYAKDAEEDSARGAGTQEVSLPDATFRSAAGNAHLGQYTYRLHGLVLSSEIELPELGARRIGSAVTPDVHIRIGAVARADDASPASFEFARRADGAGCFVIPEIAQYIVKDGRDIVVAPSADVDFALIRLFLLGWAMNLILLQRHILALHASAVAFGDQVVAFAGDAGAGKSTAAAHCVEVGARLVADDMLRVSFVGAGVAVHPGVPQLKLWRHALDGLNRPADDCTPVYWREDKFWVPAASAVEDRMLPLVRVYMLEGDESDADISQVRLTGAAALTALVANTHGWVKSVEVAGWRPGHFKDCAELARRVEVVRLKRRFVPEELPKMAARIAAEFET